jgi:hypothetical protein
MAQSIPFIQMSQQQKMRINEIGLHLSGAIWARLNRIEKWAVCEGIHGMKINIDNVFNSFQHSIHIRKENDKREEIVVADSESFSDDPDHNEGAKRKSKRIRLQTQAGGNVKQ